MNRLLSGARTGAAIFWVASMSVGLAAFVVLAVLAHTLAAGGLADASAVISVSFVLAVFPGAIQLRAAAAAANPSAKGAEPAPVDDHDGRMSHNAAPSRGVEHAPPRQPEPQPRVSQNAAPSREMTHARRAHAGVAGVPVRLVAGVTAALLLATPLIATALTVPILAIALLVVQFPVACFVAVQRGTAIGRADHRNASISMAADAACRLAAGIGFGIAFGATGLALALLLGTVAAGVAGRGWYGRIGDASAAAIVGPALTVGVLMLLVNLDVFAAPRVLGAHAADAYAVAELPAKGVFFALFAVSWLAVPIAARSRRAGELLAPIGGVLAVGAAAVLTLWVVRPLLSIALGDPAPAAGLLTTLTVAMTVAAALATALAMAVARDAWHPWAPSLAATIALALVVASLRPDGQQLAGFVLTAQTVALIGTVASLLRTAAPRALATARTPLLARR